MQQWWQVVDDAVVRHRQAENDHERSLLRHEATMLALARHPGVVEVVAIDEHGDRLVTRASAPATLDGAWPPRPHGPDLDSRADRVPGRRPVGSTGWWAALAAAAQTVADLHALGVVHDDLRPGVIWVDHRGQAILDGFTRAGLAGQQLEGRPRLRPSTDVAALAQLAATGGEAEGRRARRSGRGPGLAAVLDMGRSGTWPPARRLAVALEAEAARAGGTRPGSRSLHPSRPSSSAEPPTSPVATPPPESDPFARLRPPDLDPVRRRPPVAAVACAVVGALALAWGAVALVGHAARPSLRPVARPAAAPAAPSPAAPRVVVDGTTYRIGRRGDQVQVGRWSCGPARAVVLRPSTGQVFAFAGWARSGHDLVARPVGQVAVGSRLANTQGGTGCDRLVARSPDGTTIPLDPEVTR